MPAVILVENQENINQENINQENINQENINIRPKKPDGDRINIIKNIILEKDKYKHL